LDARQNASDTIEQPGNAGSKRLRASGNGEGDEDDKHSIFGRRGTALITAVAIDQTKHLKVLPASEAWPYCQCVPKGDLYRHSADAQINRTAVSGLSKLASENRLF
jgi:hypothetical protein